MRCSQILSYCTSLPPITMLSLEDQVALLMQQIQVLQNQLSAWTMSLPVDPPPPPTTTKLLKIAASIPFTGLQDDLDCFKAERSLYICLQGSKFSDKMSQMLFILSYMKGGATRMWAMHKIQQVLNPSKMLIMMDEFKAEVNLMFTDPNQEATVQQRLSSLWQGANSVNELIQQFKIHRPMSRLGDARLVHHFKQVLNSHLGENIYQLHPMPRTWAEWKHKASILNNQWRWFNATCPQMTMAMKNPVTTSSCSTLLHSTLCLPITCTPYGHQQVDCSA